MHHIPDSWIKKWQFTVYETFFLPSHPGDDMSDLHPKKMRIVRLKCYKYVCHKRILCKLNHFAYPAITANSLHFLFYLLIIFYLPRVTTANFLFTANANISDFGPFAWCSSASYWYFGNLFLSGVEFARVLLFYMLYFREERDTRSQLSLHFFVCLAVLWAMLLYASVWC